MKSTATPIHRAIPLFPPFDDDPRLTTTDNSFGSIDQVDYRLWNCSHRRHHYVEKESRISKSYCHTRVRQTKHRHSASFLRQCLLSAKYSNKKKKTNCTLLSGLNLGS